MRMRSCMWIVNPQIEVTLSPYISWNVMDVIKQEFIITRGDKRRAWLWKIGVTCDCLEF